MSESQRKAAVAPQSFVFPEGEVLHIKACDAQRMNQKSGCCNSGEEQNIIIIEIKTLS